MATIGLDKMSAAQKNALVKGLLTATESGRLQWASAGFRTFQTGIDDNQVTIHLEAGPSLNAASYVIGVKQAGGGRVAEFDASHSSVGSYREPTYLFTNMEQLFKGAEKSLEKSQKDVVKSILRTLASEEDPPRRRSRQL